MKAKINRDGCISCGMCAELCPEVFFMADDGLADAHPDVPKDAEASAVSAQENCPVSVIEVEG